MKEKTAKKSFAKYFWLSLHLLASLILIVESSFVGEISQTQSNNFADGVANFFDSFSATETKTI